MFALERMLGKDAMSVVCKELHQILRQQLNAEYCACVRARQDGCVLWNFAENEIAYNYRHDYQIQSCIFNKQVEMVALLPKNY